MRPWLLYALLLTAARAAPLSPTVELRGGVLMPSVGLGNSGSCGPDSFGTPDGSPCALYNATLQWFKLGGRAVHTALSYCGQFGVGKAAADSGLARSELFLMSMVPKFLMGYNETRAAVAASLQQMNQTFLDLVMIHHRAADIADWPREICPMQAFPHVKTGDDGKALWGPPPCAAADPTWVQCQDETWRALVDLKKEKKIRAIGVSNWRVQNLQRMVDLGMELPAVNQVEVHVGYHEDDLIAFCAKHGIVVQAASPLARSLPALIKPGENAAITAIAQAHGKTTAQVALRFLLDKGVAIIPSVSSAKYQLQNLDVFDFHLSSDELKTLNQMALPCRGAANMGLQKCWGDPATMMCMDAEGNMFHCP